MPNRLPLTIPQQVADEIKQILSKTLHEEIQVIDHRGIIISSTQPERVGTWHEGGASLLGGEEHEIFISTADEAIMKGVHAGYGMALSMDGQIIGVIGISGDPHKVKPYVELAAEFARLRIKNYYLELTEYRATIDKLQGMENNFFNLVERANDGIAILQDFKVQYVNATFSQMLGYPANEVLGVDFLFYIHPTEKEKIKRNYEMRMAGQEIPSVYETVFLHQDGESMDVELNAGLVMFRGRPANLVIARDITERKKAMEALLHAYNKARELEQAKTDFLSTVSHELRTPLTSVLGFARLTQKKFEEVIAPATPADDRKVTRAARQIKDNLQVMVKEGERLTSLINDVLDIARIEAGRIEWRKDEVDLAAVVQQAAITLTPQLEQKGLELRLELAEKLPPMLGDRERLFQVVINLLSNAVKFTEAGQISCRAWQEGEELCVSVSDTGIGIPPEKQETVFERFMQLGNNLTDKPRGTGLGLPICKEIVEHHGGRIWAESNPGQGSTFTFSLPRDGTKNQ